jgi:hypothetical protein
MKEQPMSKAKFIETLADIASSMFLDLGHPPEKVAAFRSRIMAAKSYEEAYRIAEDYFQTGTD